MRGLVAAGLGVALLPATTGGSPQQFSEIGIDTPRTMRTIGMAWVADRPLSAPAAAFRNFLLASGSALLDPEAEPAHDDRPGE